MKKRLLIGLALVLAVGLVIWYMTPIHIADMDPADVGEIVIFDGNTGKKVQISDAVEIERVMESLRSVRLVRTGLAGATDGFNLDMAINLKNGERADDFVINSAESVHSGAFIYKVSGGTIEYSYLKQLVNGS